MDAMPGKFWLHVGILTGALFVYAVDGLLCLVAGLRLRFLKKWSDESDAVADDYLAKMHAATDLDEETE